MLRHQKHTRCAKQRQLTRRANHLSPCATHARCARQLQALRASHHHEGLTVVAWCRCGCSRCCQHAQAQHKASRCGCCPPHGRGRRGGEANRCCGACGTIRAWLEDVSEWPVERMKLVNHCLAVACTCRRSNSCDVSFGGARRRWCMWPLATSITSLVNVCTRCGVQAST
jgi:hypothetical protein